MPPEIVMQWPHTYDARQWKWSCKREFGHVINFAVTFAAQSAAQIRRALTTLDEHMVSTCRTFKFTALEEIMRRLKLHFCIIFTGVARVPQRIGYEVKTVGFGQQSSEDSLTTTLSSGTRTFPIAIILDAAISGRRSPILVSFYEPSPSAGDVMEAVKLISSELSKRNMDPAKKLQSVRYTEAIPWNYLNSSLFRINGTPNHKLTDLVITPLARTAQSSRSTTSETAVDSIADELTNDLDSFKIAVDNREVIIYIRASTYSQTDKSHSIERQYESILHDLRDCNLISITTFLEYFSSSRHPLQDRLITKRAITAGENPRVLLSINRDRITRRSNEIEELITELRSNNINWYTQGAVEAPAIWHNLHEDHTWVPDNLEVGRAIALQHGFYTRSVKQLARIISAEKDESFNMMKLAVQQFAEANQITKYIILIRISPSVRENTKPVEPMSLERQMTFLKLFLLEGSDVKVIRLEGVSSFSDDAIIKIGSRLADLAEPHLILVTAVDRLSRNPVHLSKLQTLLNNGSHLMISFLWQYQSILENTDPNYLHSVMPPSSHQLLISQYEVSNPLSRPIVWPMSYFYNNVVNPSVSKDCNNASNFCMGFQYSSRQGDPKLSIDDRLLRGPTDTKRGFCQARKERWSQVAADITNLDLDKIHIVSPEDMDSRSWY